MSDELPYDGVKDCFQCEGVGEATYYKPGHGWGWYKCDLPACIAERKTQRKKES